MRVFSDIAAAFALLTVVPVRSSQRPTPRVVAWFPWVGAVLGGLTWGALELVELANETLVARASLIVAVLVIAAWAAGTRFLHWDGLADVGDAWWGGHAPERRREIMSDSHVGAFGVTAIVLVALLQVSALNTLLANGDKLVVVALVPVFGRFAPLFAAWLGTPARADGLGASVMGRPGLGAVLVAALAAAAATALAWWYAGVAGIALAAGSIFAAAAVPHLIAQRMGGVTGDVMGASVTLAEAVALLAFALYAIW